MAERAELVIDGQPFSGWKAITVSSSIEAVCGTFQFQASEVAPDDVRSRPIRRGNSCEVYLEGDLVLTGHVDQVARKHTKTTHSVSVSGRSLAADLVDCSVTHVPGEWHERSILQIAADLAAPFSVTVRADVATGAVFPTFRTKPAETAFAAIERMARQRGLLLTSDPAGAVVMTRAKTEREPLHVALGSEVLEAGVVDSEVDRFSLYRFTGQQQGSDAVSGLEAAQVYGEASDPLVTRFRPTVRVAETQGTSATLRERARWEAARRAGLAHRPQVVVRDWRNSAGSLWRPNTLLRMVDDFLEIDGELLIVSATYQSDTSGRRTTLSLSRPEAFDVLPIPEKTSGEPELWLTSSI